MYNKRLVSSDISTHMTLIGAVEGASDDFDGACEGNPTHPRISARRPHRKRVNADD